ncbi:MAG: lysophospholipid acyltransferase family protein [Verrucomicrobiota bacterium]
MLEMVTCHMKKFLRTLLYRICRLICRMFFLPSCRVLVRGRPEPCEAPLIFAGNHISHFDPPMFGLQMKSVIDFMAMRELFLWGWSNWLFTNIYAIPVDLGVAGIQSLRTAAQRLKEKRFVCIFPEGGIRSGVTSILEQVPIPPGAALLSMQSQVPIQPFIILGTEQFYAWKAWFRRTEVQIHFGQRIEPVNAEGKRRKRDELNTLLDQEIKRLYGQWKAGPDFVEALVPRTAQERWAEEKERS